MNDNWRPDWRDEKAYEHLKRVSNEEIAWEFLRRNEQYANDWHDNPRDSVVEIDEMIVLEKCPSGAAINHYDRLCQEYMVRKLYHPSTPPSQVCFWFHLQWQNFSESSGAPDIEIYSGSQVLIKFDMEYNIEKQLDFAKWHLEELKKNIETKDVRVTKDRDKLITFLRTLDAAQQGTSKSKIGQELDPLQDNFSKTGARLHKSALEYCKHKYKLLAFT